MWIRNYIICIFRTQQDVITEWPILDGGPDHIASAAVNVCVWSFV